MQVLGPIDVCYTFDAANRIQHGWAQLGKRTTDEDYTGILTRLRKPLLEYFRMFYGDTALFGSASGLRCGLDFFGAERVLFASCRPAVVDPQVPTTFPAE